MKNIEQLQGIVSPIPFYPDLVPLAGSQEAAIFLCHLIYWQSKEANPLDWISKTQIEWCLSTGLSDQQQKNARRYLVSRGFIQEKYKGISGKLQYRLMKDDLDEIWNCWLVAAQIKQECKKLNQNFQVLSSHAARNDEAKLKLEKYKQGYYHCERVLTKFFKNCKREGCSPISKLKELAEQLNQIAETLEKSIISQSE